ncbi:MAG TPA: pilus assembly protein N-terminal domain-containing protein [Polyangiales bacterium]|nr:pilus assembly protein N-terminal domain-containing protein [Polyangiales bacterium]
MKWLFALLLWIPFAASAQQPQLDTGEELTLAVGENRTIPANDVKNYSEGAPGIAEVKITPGGSQFVIVGQRPGATTLLLLKRDGREVVWHIRVLPQPVQIVESELHQLLGEVPGIRVRRVGARFFVEGGVTTEPELERITHIASLYPGQVESLVVLGGVAADRKINLRVDLFFVQYQKTHTMNFGVAWPTVIGGAGIASADFAYDLLAKATSEAVAGISQQPLPGLDIAARNGWAKLLKHATVLTANGGEAEVGNGGAQWYQANNGLTSSLREIDFGTNMKILPRFDAQTNELLITVNADATDLAPPITQGTSLPSTNTSKINTSVTMKLGQCLVLSGIRTDAKRRNKTGIPWLSEIPVIGLLFGSHQHQDDELEGSVFVIPSVIEAPAVGATARIERTLREYEKYSGDLDKVAPFDAMPPGVK